MVSDFCVPRPGFGGTSLFGASIEAEFFPDQTEKISCEIWDFVLGLICFEGMQSVTTGYDFVMPW